MSARVTIADYGVGNLLKVARAVDEAGGTPRLGGDFAAIADADRLILPGVGAFSHGMRGLADRGLVDAIHAFVKTGRPFLGICLGMQMMLGESHEFGAHAGLDLIAGTVCAIPKTTGDGNRQGRAPTLSAALPGRPARPRAYAGNAWLTGSNTERMANNGTP